MKKIVVVNVNLCMCNRLDWSKDNGILLTQRKHDNSQAIGWPQLSTAFLNIDLFNDNSENTVTVHKQR